MALPYLERIPNIKDTVLLGTTVEITRNCSKCHKITHHVISPIFDQHSGYDISDDDDCSPSLFSVGMR